MSEPYAIVSSCDGQGEFAVLGIHPNRKRKDFTHYYVGCKLTFGVRSTKIAASRPNDNYDLYCERNYAVKIAIHEALALFIDPMVAQTAVMPADFVAAIRWFERYRKPGPHRHQELIAQPLAKNQYDEMLTRTLSMLQSSAFDAEKKPLNQDAILRHFQTLYVYNNWFLSPEGLSTLGLTSVDLEKKGLVFEKWVKSEALFKLLVQMVAHSRMIYTLGGDDNASKLWHNEYDILMNQTLADSAVAHAIWLKTKEIASLLPDHFSSTGYRPSRASFFKAGADELVAVKLLRGHLAVLASKFYISQQPELFWSDLWVGMEPYLQYHVRRGITSYAAPQIPGFDGRLVTNECISQIVFSVLQVFEEWFLKCAKGLHSPITEAPIDPPKSLEKALKRVVQNEEPLFPFAKPLVAYLSVAFWDLMCLAFHPKLFEYPPVAVACRKQNCKPRVVIPNKTCTILPLTVEAFCVYNDWIERFSPQYANKLLRFMTIVPDPSEDETVRRTFCPRYFVAVEGSSAIQPTEALLEKAREKDLSVVCTTLKLLATLAPKTTTLLLNQLTAMGKELFEQQHEHEDMLEKTRSTSTTKAHRVCNYCGKQDVGKRLLNCSKCNVVRYCSPECQKSDWPKHKKTCVEVSNPEGSLQGLAEHLNQL